MPSEATGRTAMNERRRAPRRQPSPGEPVSRVRLRIGSELEVIDLSDLGAQVEGPARLLPGRHVDVHVVTRAGRTLVRSRVVRAHVTYLDARSVRYRAAVAFERAVDTSPAGYGLPEILADDAGGSGNSYPEIRESADSLL